MKLKIKAGESFRIETDSGVNIMLLIGQGYIHVTAEEAGEPTRVVIEDKNVRMEVA